jgi:hypothetical protein
MPESNSNLEEVYTTSYKESGYLEKEDLLLKQILEVYYEFLNMFRKIEGIVILPEPSSNDYVHQQKKKLLLNFRLGSRTIGIILALLAVNWQVGQHFVSKTYQNHNSTCQLATNSANSAKIMTMI